MTADTGRHAYNAESKGSEGLPLAGYRRCPPTQAEWARLVSTIVCMRGQMDGPRTS